MKTGKKPLAVGDRVALYATTDSFESGAEMRTRISQKRTLGEVKAFNDFLDAAFLSLDNGNLTWAAVKQVRRLKPRAPKEPKEKEGEPAKLYEQWCVVYPPLGGIPGILHEYENETDARRNCGFTGRVARLQEVPPGSVVVSREKLAATLKRWTVNAKQVEHELFGFPEKEQK